MEIPYTKRTLSNGLDVIVHEDRSCPIVGVNVWYHVGSKDEHPGRTGFAHLFEHLMFEGSQHHDRGYFQPLQEAGAAVNGSTNTDRTNYWELVPTNALELALWMESDRMGYLLPALTQHKLDNQRDVVLNERRQNYENRPYGLASIAAIAALYPPNHPYHWPTIGSAEDLRAARLEDVQGFFRTHYRPGNASLVIAGDVATSDALRLAELYFGEIPRGTQPPAAELSVPPALSDPQARLVLEDAVELPRLYLVWHSPALFAEGDAALDLFADLFCNGKTSRLYRRLVYEQRLASEVGGVQSSRELCSIFQVIATAAPGHELVELYDAIQDELSRLLDSGISGVEIERAQAQAEAQFIYRLQSVGGFGGVSDQLNAYNVLLAEPDSFQRDLERYRSMTPDLVRAAVARHLSPGQCVAVSVVPRGQAHRALTGSVRAVVS